MYVRNGFPLFLFLPGEIIAPNQAHTTLSALPPLSPIILIYHFIARRSFRPKPKAKWRNLLKILIATGDTLIFLFVFDLLFSFPSPARQ